jgi:hypothetical protein
MVEVRAAAEACARRNIWKKSGVRLVDAPQAKAAKKRVLSVDYVVHANIKIYSSFRLFLQCWCSCRTS